MKDIFISYSHADCDLVHPIVDELIKRGYHCWIDKNKEEDLPDGCEFSPVIRQAILDCQLFVTFLSKSYTMSRYCKTEYDFNNATSTKHASLYIRLDDIAAETAGDNAYMVDFFPSGQNLLGYNKPLNTFSVEEACNQICQTFQFGYIRKNGDFKKITPDPNLYASEELFYWMEESLNDSDRKTIKQMLGGKVQDQMFSTLTRIPFCRAQTESADSDSDSMEPDRQDEYDEDDFWDEFEENFWGEAGENEEEAPPEEMPEEQPQSAPEKQEVFVSLKDYLLSTPAQQHVFLVNDGGCGKTTTLLNTCKQLLQEKKHALYVPLKDICKDKYLEHYLQANLCHGNDYLKKIFDTMMQSSAPTYLFLDGLNEMPKNWIDSFIHELYSYFLPSHPAVRLIIASRYDSRKDPKFSDYPSLAEADLLCLNPLSDSSVQNQLAQFGLELPTDRKLLELLKKPLMLALYCDTEAQQTSCRNASYLQFRSPPRTAGTLLHNYFQVQLFRVKLESDTSNLVLMELMLPMLALEMVKADTFVASKEMLQNCLLQVTPSSKHPYLSWFDQDRLHTVTGEINSFNDQLAGQLANIGIMQLHFLIKDGETYSFSNHIFRDYFAACFLCFEIRHLAGNGPSSITPVLEQHIYPEDVLALAADILNEAKFAPTCKNRKKDNEKSAVESLLAQYRGKTGPQTRNAVCNLFQILRLGRNGKLYLCDFSHLDLRSCKLAGTMFSEYRNGRVYASSFDRAWLDFRCFIGVGHSSIISAVCQDSMGRLCTGDFSGNLLIWNETNTAPVKTLSVVNERILHLLPEPQGSLLILTRHTLHRLNFNSWDLTRLSETHRYYFDVRLNSSGQPEVCYDTDAMFWQSIRTGSEDAEPNHQESGLQLTGCRAIHPDGNQLICSDLFGTIRKYIRNTEENRWQYTGESFSCSQLTKGVRISNLAFLPSGDRFLVAYGHTVFCISYPVMEPIHQLTFPDYVNAVCCLSDQRIAVCHGLFTTILWKDFTRCEDLPGFYRPAIRMAKQMDGLTYLLTANAELKVLDQNLNLILARKLSIRPFMFTFAYKKPQNDTFLVFLASSGHRTICRGYIWNMGLDTSLNGRRYEIVDEREDLSEPSYEQFTDGAQMLSIHRKSGRTHIFHNYPGIFLCGCSFRNIRTEQDHPELQAFLHQNGGIIA